MEEKILYTASLTTWPMESLKKFRMGLLHGVSFFLFHSTNLAECERREPNVMHNEHKIYIFEPCVRQF